MRETIERSQKAAKKFEVVTTLIGILVMIGGSFLGYVTASSFESFHYLTLIIYIIGSVLSGLLLIYIGHCVLCAMDCLCLITQNTGSKYNVDEYDEDEDDGEEYED